MTEQAQGIPDQFLGKRGGHETACGSLILPQAGGAWKGELGSWPCTCTPRPGSASGHHAPGAALVTAGMSVTTTDKVLALTEPSRPSWKGLPGVPGRHQEALSWFGPRPRNLPQ